MNAPKRLTGLLGARVPRVAALAAALVLAGCVVAPPPGPILSRLPPGAPGAASSAQPLSDTEKKRYDEIDKQVQREQNAAMAVTVWARSYAPYYYSPPVMYGGYYSGWGLGYYSPGFYPGWWW
ncbi:hypothetical protein WKR88_19125 [Trinickia caryophylli]|uniref:Lipoprotein n=1 Tax=Trinickia caryophylli TaxID=28094 RepID=A0A1X7DG46_TRICW|nr:hypothetical protein [Trinickia caryophylli]PMS08662.1 hypothetical protein C0Z17_29125 [Trinickia caryophylli]TRX16922.1 hypothetical protein FNF07_00855 [Trinickia caryophylli]WQE12347.1 hypothetical protein U0034_02685 [Trinickia caryophylli]SMF14839.1 hypothetical protein SAMN06295900_103136 [Trinickia caryophylli]GLU31506.1 lipoprotein [Trinickia caryophylli]